MQCLILRYLFKCKHPENEPLVYCIMIEDALVSC